MNHQGTQTLAPRPVRDPEARERLLLEHLPQVRYIARRIHDRLPAQVPLEDLIHAGVVGLIDAVEKFDPSKNVQLKSYAKFRIRGAILDSLRELDWSPRHLRRKARQIEEAHLDLKLRLGRVASEPELAVELGMNLEEFQHLLGELRGLDLGSLQTESTDTKSDEEAMTYRPGGADKDPFFLCLRGEMKSLVASALEDLDNKERQVVTLYYLEELTMKEVGAVLGVGESRVSQIHSAALVRLRMEGIYGKDPEPGRNRCVIPRDAEGPNSGRAGQSRAKRRLEIRYSSGRPDQQGPSSRTVGASGKFCAQYYELLRRLPSSRI
jgi:RNA polymerase sigma factor FliA